MIVTPHILCGVTHHPASDPERSSCFSTVSPYSNENAKAVLLIGSTALIKETVYFLER
ncbi:hypothetical protein NBRC111894_251 [Sporolactobacillus inulinus]|uniref:Uncharacterized protein n=1 Tax=Sporolactobacillus inulinus TaxID=2078 RepID=A0A4Y1Z6N1_9BACL|nr:hypothetical protein NBRC111894_251 [Sporolactobacillus inulinus]